MKILFSTVFILMLAIACRESLPVEKFLGDREYELLNQDGVSVNFPKIIEGKVAILGYIFTNCPDICPLTTNNMRLVQEKLNKKNIHGVEFVSITFDPIIDNPSVLTKYAGIRNLNTLNWSFLTGEKEVIDTLMKNLGIMAVVGDSSVIEGETVYFYIHTDRISLVDKSGNIRKNYMGSKVDIDEIINDIETLIE